MSISGLVGPPQGKLVDVGSGNGEFLATMRDFGWDVLGVDPDGQAAQVAQEQRRVPVRVGTLHQVGLPSGFADAVTLGNVIEHVPDPIAFLRECRRVLKPGGRLVLLTPNTQSLGHRVFRETWLPLEQPRHLCLFSSQTLRAAVEGAGFRVQELRSTGRSARGIWWQSWMVRRHGTVSSSDKDTLLRATGWAFQAVEEGLRHVWREAGEELFLVGTA